MNAKRCDRCGKFYTLTDYNRILLPVDKNPAFGEHYHHIEVYYNDDEYKAPDLCPDCVNDLIDWFFNPRGMYASDETYSIPEVKLNNADHTEGA